MKTEDCKLWSYYTLCMLENSERSEVFSSVLILGLLQLLMVTHPSEDYVVVNLLLLWIFFSDSLLCVCIVLVKVLGIMTPFIREENQYK